jgi:demethylmenaquinone methyltransferase/2-methoxy-6-polyprenyl-1,4-benzoquinol methylase
MMDRSAATIRDMFAQVAPRYDLLNHLLSFNIDRYWRAKTVKLLRPILERPDAKVLDLCCGTGDLTIALARGGRARVFGADFCHPMLQAALRKSGGVKQWFEADALCVPSAAGAFDLVTAAFGFRNLSDYDQGLSEMRRVLKPGGTAAILEFSTPPNRAFSKLYSAYSKHILPRVGGAISGSREAYSYLPQSVSRFPTAEHLATMMRSAGFKRVKFERMTMGIVALHIGETS